MPAEPLIPPHGGYRKLKSFQVAQLAYDVTVRFVDRYIDRFSSSITKAALPSACIVCAISGAPETIRNNP